VFIDETQATDEDPSLMRAEAQWALVREDQMFRNVKAKVLEEKMREIRPICLNQKKIKSIATRMWNFVAGLQCGPEEATKRVRSHLSLYENVKSQIFEGLKLEALRGLKYYTKKEDQGMRDRIWKRLIAFEAVTETERTS
jgi:hypothetical protein